jgi:hypothetical protein
VTNAAPIGSADLAYLVERYLSAADSAELEAAVGRLIHECHATLDTAAPVHYLYSTLVPAEDTCFCVFRAGSSDAVRAVNLAARFGFDRISNARVMLPAD